MANAGGRFGQQAGAMCAAQVAALSILTVGLNLPASGTRRWGDFL
jgi:hypothetical protein